MLSLTAPSFARTDCRALSVTIKFAAARTISRPAQLRSTLVRAGGLSCSLGRSRIHSGPDDLLSSAARPSSCSHSGSRCSSLVSSAFVADSAYLYVWSGRVQDAAQLSAQSGADSIDPRISTPMPARAQVALARADRRHQRRGSQGLAVRIPALMHRGRATSPGRSLAIPRPRQC